MAPKIAIIGGGSAYAPGLIHAFIQEAAAFQGAELALMDLAAEQLETVAALARKMAAAAGADLTISATTDRRAAVDGADYVLTTFRQGGFAARHLDDARQVLIDLVVALNGADRPPSPSRVNQYLGPLQRDAFEKTLPVRAATAESWIGQAVALIVLYRWYAPQLVEIHPIDYPTALEKSVLALLSAEVDGWPAMVRSA